MVAVDKTGTLTEGRPVLTDLDVASGFERREVLAKVAAVESRSEHPIARAIVVSAEEEGSALPGMNGFESVTGMGVYATVDGTRVDVWGLIAICAKLAWILAASPPPPNG